MIDLIIGVIFAAIYVTQYRKWYYTNQNTKYDDFLIHQCIIFALLLVAIKFFRPLTKTELGLRKLARSIGTS